MNDYYERAVFFMERRRFEEAEEILRQAITADPYENHFHSLLAHCLAAQDKLTEALRTAEVAVGIVPDSDYSLYTLALMRLQNNLYTDALNTIQRAIQINPEESRYFWVLGLIRMNNGEDKLAQDAFEAGLKLRPDDEKLMELHALILEKGGNRKQATQAMDSAFALNPESADLHDTKGWMLLSQGKGEAASAHFYESLRLDPNSSFALEGIHIAEALKIRSPIFHPIFAMYIETRRYAGNSMLLYFVILAIGWILVRWIGSFGWELAVIFLPLAIILQAYVLIGMTEFRLLNLLLRLSRPQKLKLSKNEVMASNAVALCILAALILFLLAITLEGRERSALLDASGQTLMMMIPSSLVFVAPTPERKASALIWSLGSFIWIIAGVILWTLTDLGIVSGSLFLPAWVVYLLIAGIVVARMEHRHKQTD